jgi:3-hydroxybutyrate dehydrogenase
MAGMLAGKAALVTGSTSGIGLAMIKALAGAGANVALHGLGDPSAIQKIQDELKDQHGIQTLYSGADLKQPKLIREMVKQVHDTFGRIDILVNNAGRHPTAQQHA